MTTKLTLSMDKAIIDKAKDYANKTGRSLSNLVASYLETLVESDRDYNAASMPPKLRKLFGAVQLPANLDHRKEIRKILTSKSKK